MTGVTAAIDLLEMEGPTLGRPTVDKVKGSKFHSMKELRPAGRRHGCLPGTGVQAGMWRPVAHRAGDLAVVRRRPRRESADRADFGENSVETA
jgi:hypothetical protein